MEAALLLELGAERLVADPVMVPVGPAGHDVPERRYERRPAPPHDQEGRRWSAMTYTHEAGRAKRLGPDGQRRLEALLAKGQLDQFDRGALRALARAAAPHDRARAEDKLRPGTGRTREQVRIDDATIAKWAEAIDKALEREGDRW